MIDAYRLVSQTHPDVQLALVGSMAHDDPEGWDYYNRTVAHAAGDPDIFILSNLNNVGSVEVNAFQVHSARCDPEVDPRGVRPDRDRGALEGAGRRSAGASGGIVAQIKDGETGWLVDSPEECADACREILDDPVGRGGSRPSREGRRPRALPDAAPAARLARALQPARRERSRRDGARNRRGRVT